MTTCLHNHPRTRANTYVYRAPNGKEYERCKLCQSANQKRFMAGKTKPKKKKSDKFKKPGADGRLECRFKPCRATAQTEDGRVEHERRFHYTWNEGRLGA